MPKRHTDFSVIRGAHARNHLFDKVKSATHRNKTLAALCGNGVIIFYLGKRSLVGFCEDKSEPSFYLVIRKKNGIFLKPRII